MAIVFEKSFETKLLYVYRINDEAHKDVLKVGEASVDTDAMSYLTLEPNCKVLNEAAKKRIKEQTQTAGITFELLYTEITAFSDKKTIKVFQDHEVHSILERSGIKHKYFNNEHKANEWFYTDLETIKKAIIAAKEGRTSLKSNEITTELSPIIFRPEQNDAINKTVKMFQKKTGSHQMLWNAKMRFGKTLSALQVIKNCKYKRSLIITHRPVVDEGWYEDFKKIFYDTENYTYVSKNNGEVLRNIDIIADSSSTNYVCFASMQDMRGSEVVGGKFEKNETIFNINWDLIIVDEAHEGTQTELGQKVLKECKKENTRVLHLSGTPFNLMDDFDEDEIFTWDYIMEQKSKKEWDIIHQGDPNPYACLPKLNIYTYDLGKLFADYADADIAFNFKEFFRVEEDGRFKHETNIIQFLDLLTKEDDESNYPFSKQEYRDNFRHSLWMIPGVKEAKALSQLLQDHPVFSQFNIANVAGDGDEEVETKDALALVNNAIGKNPEETYSITLSCGRLTTGVSVKPWTACLMLSGSYNTAASAYMQTIFRVQTPAIIAGKQKTECFVFDFAPDRTLKVIAETAKISSKAGNTSTNDRKILGEFINFCPIIGFEGSRTVAYDTEKMLEQLKKVYVEKVVRNGFEDNYLYNSDLMKLDAIELEEFSKLKKIIGTTKAMASTGDIDINAIGLNDEEYEELGKKKTQKEKRELTPEEEERLARLAEAKKNRESAISILRGISIRMPLMIYGADLNKELDGEEEEITIDNFADKIDNQSWEEFMPSGVTKEIFSNFKKYYDKDIFRAAGKKIRQMAKAADNFSIEDRIERIANIFNSFRNPDKETVLTPWRVVNMHMTDCLGGYRFYDNEYNDTIEEPEFIEQANVTKNVYKKNTHILEINSKSGLYALFCAYSVYKTRAKLELGPKATREMEKELWRNVLKDNIFVICKTPMAKSITKRTLAGFSDMKVNAHYFEDLVNQLKNKPENFIDKVLKSNYWKKEGRDMKFDAIVGNPPYQEMDGGAGSSSMPVYNKFVEVAKKINPLYISMVMPSRWMTGGKGLSDFRENMIKDTHIRTIHDYFDSKMLFSSVSIEGGICYFLWDGKEDGKCHFVSHTHEQIVSSDRYLSENNSDIVIRDVSSISILRKIENNFTSFSNIVSPRNLFKINESLLENTYTSQQYKVFGRFNNIRGYKYLNDYNANDKKIADCVNSYKIFISKADGAAGQLGNPIPARILGKTKIGNPKTLCTETFLVIGPFKTQEIAENVQKYLKTKFLRFIVGIRKLKNMTQETYQFVPLQDFTENSDINWSKTVAEIDLQLYKKYDLEKSEIDFIEKMIQTME